MKFNTKEHWLELLNYYLSATKKLWISLPKAIKYLNNFFSDSLLANIHLVYSFIAHFLYLSSLHTLTFICFFNFIRTTNLKSFLLLILAYLLDNAFKGIGFIWASYQESKDLLDYQKTLSNAGFQLKAESIESFIADEKLSAVLHQEGQEFIFKIPKKLGKIFIVSHPDACTIGGFKAFPNRGTHRVVGDKTILVTQSAIFVDSDFEEMSDFRKFMLFHELGHLSDVSLHLEAMQKRIISHFLSVFLIAIFIFKVSIFSFLLFIAPLFILKGFFNRKTAIERNVEEYSDLFALSFFDSEGIDKLLKKMSYIYPKERIHSLNECRKRLQRLNIDFRGFQSFGLVRMNLVEWYLSLIPTGLLIYFSLTMSSLTVNFTALIVIFLVTLTLELCIPIFVSALVSNQIPRVFDTEME